MKKLLLMAILFSALSCIGQDGKLPDKKTMAVIKKAEKVCLYYVNPLTENFSRGNIQGIAIEKDFGKINTADKDSLIFLIYENISNYKKGGANKMCAFIPDYVFQFHKGKDTIDLMVDFQCNIMEYCYEDKKYRVDIDDIDQRLKLLISNYSFVEDILPAINTQTETIIPKDIQDQLSSSDSLSWYILDPMEQLEDISQSFNGALILQQKTDVYITQISEFLLSPSSFSNSDLYKECVFLPDLGIRFYGKNNQTVDVMFSFYCNECKIISDKTIFTADCAKIRHQIIGYAKNVFPMDKYLRIMFNQ